MYSRDQKKKKKKKTTQIAKYNSFLVIPTLIFLSYFDPCCTLTRRKF